LADIACGTVTPPMPLDPLVAGQLRRRQLPDRTRARTLSTFRPQELRRIWPHLGLISCWRDGPAAPAASQMAELFPGVPLQPKGLLATEAFVTLPLWGKEGGVLAVTSHFFEFLAADGEPRLAHELVRGHAYEGGVTTAGGFYCFYLPAPGW